MDDLLSHFLKVQLEAVGILFYKGLSVQLFLFRNEYLSALAPILQETAVLAVLHKSFSVLLSKIQLFLTAFFLKFNGFCINQSVPVSGALPRQWNSSSEGILWLFLTEV